jgi:uncharacterized protein (DUF1499 family)
MMKTILIVLLVAVASWALLMTLLSQLAKKPDGLGARDGRLAPCPDSPNCVSSQAEDERHRIEPIRFDGDSDEAWKRLRERVAARPRTRIVTEADGYLHAECTSLIFRFVDDLECLLDRDARLIHVRSASRAGHSDFGVNRRRVEELRRGFTDTSPAPRD